MSREHYHFVTGRLAAASLRRVVESLSQKLGFDYSIGVMPITVAALMTPKWIARHLEVPAQATRVMVPGYCADDLGPIATATGLPVERGPRDHRQLPEHFGHQADRSDYGAYDIEILAEINHAPRLSLDQIVDRAKRFAADGADVIDLGCDPQGEWRGVGDAVRALRDSGLRVSIDSYSPAEIAPAARAGADLVLSVNATNREHASDWGCEVVAVPDSPESLDGLEETLAVLDGAEVRYRVDPILNPIGFGFSESLGRYLEARRRWPEAEMLMGIGNLTELTDADSAAINVLLLGFCQEQGIRSVLSTQEIAWARSCVKELDRARRLVHYAITHGVLPKHLEPGLVMLRDPEVLQFGREALDELAAAIKDHSYRIFVEEGRIHLVGARLHVEGTDAFSLWEELVPQAPAEVTPSHAFYLGYEMAKAVTALTLGKNYRQDEALNWGMLTVPELTRRERRARRMSRQDDRRDDKSEGREDRD